jgi:hypothetical protein
MAKSLAQRVLEMLPPKTLSEVVEFIAANGSATNVIVRAGRSQSDTVPTAFWALDHYQDEEDRVNALTALATNAISLDRAVSMYDGGANNYWQELAAMVFGNTADKEFNDTIEEDSKFDFDDATEISDFLPEDTVDAIKKSVAYQRLSKQTQKSIIGSVDYLKQARLFGAAIRALAKRANERSAYLGHYGIEVASPRAFTGDVDPKEFHLACRRFQADVMNQFLPSADPQYTGGFKKFFKKAGKLLKKVAAPIVSVVAPALAPALAVVNKVRSLGGGGSAAAPISPGSAPEYLPPQLPAHPGSSYAMPTFQDMDDALSGYVRADDPRVVVLLEVASRAMAQTRAQTVTRGMGDILTPDTTGEGPVALPLVALPQGDVIITDSGVPVMLEDYSGDPAFSGGLLKRFKRTGARVAGRAAPNGSAITIELPANQVQAIINLLQARLQQSGFTGDVADFVGELEDYHASVANGLPYQGALTRAQIDSAADAIGAALGMPSIGKVTRVITGGIAAGKQAVSKVVDSGTRAVAGAASATFGAIKDLFRSAKSKPTAFSPSSRFIALGEAVMNQMGDLTEEAPPPSGLNDLAE